MVFPPPYARLIPGFFLFVGKPARLQSAPMLIRIVFHLIALLPLRAAHAVGDFVGSVLWLTNNGRKKAALKNIGLCLPELDARQREVLARIALKHEMKSVL